MQISMKPFLKLIDLIARIISLVLQMGRVTDKRNKFE
jgi:hypothetical protein